MLLFSEGKLEKLTIEGYKKEDFSGEPEHKITVLVNPENFKESYTIEYDTAQATGDNGNSQKFHKIKSGEFTLKLLLDKTGVFDKLDSETFKKDFANQLASLVPFKDVEEEIGTGISDELAILKEMLFFKNGDIHQPEFIKFSYAKIEKRCKITKIDIDYKLFNTKGYPIRAEINLTCIDTISETLRKAEVAQNSPDLTHIRSVKEGDTLPLMTYRIYGNSKYYLEVARVNNILNFRNLIPGEEIFFPPLDKTKN